MIEDLNNHKDKELRLHSLKQLMKEIDDGNIPKPKDTGYVNNHIHTFYSFSPYSPAKAVWMAYNAGLKTAGIVDHDSLSGAEEFIEAGKIAGIATTVGIECRADFSGTLLKGKYINNPDQASIAYIVVHGVPHTRFREVEDFIRPYATERNTRNHLMVDKLNGVLKPFHIHIDFENDVIPLSKIHEGGSITERYILLALSKKLIEVCEKGDALVKFLNEKLGISINQRLQGYLTDRNNEFYEFDLIGVLKSEMLSSFYIEATSECPDVGKVIELCENTGAIATYAYLGDVVDNSVTGDKKNRKYEDEYIELLFKTIKELGFKAFTYMPSRNSHAQLERVMGLCREYGFFQISGEDINSPRQTFICEALKNKKFSHLAESTWALIGHEKEASIDVRKALFSAPTIGQYPDLYERIKAYSKFGKE